MLQIIHLVQVVYRIYTVNYLDYRSAILFYILTIMCGILYIKKAEFDTRILL